MPPSNDSCPEVDVSFVEPVLAGWGHLVMDSSFLSYMYMYSTTSATTEHPAGCIYLGPRQCAGKSVSKGHSVLVHCQTGVSRSAAIVIAYLIKYHGMSRDNAYGHVKERPRINPNPGFWEQLLIFERRLPSANQPHASDQAFNTFDRQWAERSMVQYQTIGKVLEDLTELYPEITSTVDPYLVLSAALDYISGRGVSEDDLASHFASPSQLRWRTADQMR